MTDFGETPSLGLLRAAKALLDHPVCDMPVDGPIAELMQDLAKKVDICEWYIEQAKNEELERDVNHRLLASLRWAEAYITEGRDAFAESVTVKATGKPETLRDAETLDELDKGLAEMRAAILYATEGRS